MNLATRTSLFVVLPVVIALSAITIVADRARRMDLQQLAQQEARQQANMLRAVLDRMIEPPHDTFQALDKTQSFDGIAWFDPATQQLEQSASMQNIRARLQALAVRANASSANTDVTESTDAFLLFATRHVHPRTGAPVVWIVARDAHAKEKDWNSKLVLLVISGATLFVIAAFWTTLSLAVSKPLKQLSQGIHRITQGEGEERFKTPDTTELLELENHVHQLAKKLHSTREQSRHEQQSRSDLRRSVEQERKLHQAQRVAAVEQTTATVAHEIGTPLNVIAGRARLAAKQDDVEKMRESLLVIAEQADRITRVMHRMLSFSRTRTPTMHRIDLQTIARAVVALLEPQANAQNITLALDLPANEKTTSIGSPDSMQQVIFNLVMNALQAQPTGGEVRIKVRNERDKDSLGNLRPRVILEIADRGPGIPVDMREVVFEPFATTKQKSGGSGLGLAVVKSIVTDHGGAIAIRDNVPNGALFRISLPGEDESRKESLER